MAAWFWLCAALAALLAAWTRLWATRQRTNIPGPPTLPLLGNVFHFRKLPTVVEHLRVLQRRYGDVFRFYVGPKLFVVVSRAEDAQKVLTMSKRRDSFFIRPFRTFLGDGLLTSQGSKWREHRRAIEPTFRKEVVNEFTDIFNDAAGIVCEHLAKSVGSELDVHKLFFDGALRSLVTSSLGFPIEDVLPPKMKMDEVAEMMTFGLEYTQRRVFRPWLRPEWSFFFFAEGRKYKKVVDDFHRIVRRGLAILADRTVIVQGDQQVVLVDVLLGQKGGKTFPAEDLYDQLSTFTLAGSDTAAASMSCLLTLLALYPEWQQRATQELDDIYGQGGDYLRPSTIEDLNQLVVLEAIIKETMRLFATVPVGPYVSDVDIPVDGGRFMIPSGSCVFVAYCLLHRQPNAFPNPDKFDPRRFLEGGSALGKHPYSYLPFGGGPRKCPGYRYAMVQMKSILSAVLRRFQLQPGSTREELEEAVVSATAHPITGYRVTCVPRQLPGFT